MSRDLVGTIFGRFAVLSRADANRHGHAMWNVRCSCGTEKCVREAGLLRRSSKSTKSCGCLNQERRIARNTKHGLAKRGGKHGGSGPVRRHRRRHEGHLIEAQGLAGILGRAALYLVWEAMKKRCANPNDPAFHDYGGRGITVCDRWRDDFAAFLADVGERPGPGFSLDRKDNGKGYEPGNMRWATKTEQAMNRRRRRWHRRPAEEGRQ